MPTMIMLMQDMIRRRMIWLVDTIIMAMPAPVYWQLQRMN